MKFLKNSIIVFTLLLSFAQLYSSTALYPLSLTITVNIVNTPGKSILSPVFPSSKDIVLLPFPFPTFDPSGNSVITYFGSNTYNWSFAVFDLKATIKLDFSVGVNLVFSDTWQDLTTSPSYTINGFLSIFSIEIYKQYLQILDASAALSTATQIHPITNGICNFSSVFTTTTTGSLDADGVLTITTA